MEGKENIQSVILDNFKEFSNTKNVYLAIRILLVLASIWTAHLIGYIEAIGVGVRNFIGLEVAGDLFSEFASKAVKSAIFSLLAITPVLIVLRLFKVSNFHYLVFKFFLFLCIFATIFLPSYLKVRSFTATLGYEIAYSEVLILSSLTLLFALFYFAKGWFFDVFASFIAALLLATSYYAGQLKAESFPESNLRQVIFLIIQCWLVIHCTELKAELFFGKQAILHLIQDQYLFRTLQLKWLLNTRLIEKGKETY